MIFGFGTCSTSPANFIPSQVPQRRHWWKFWGTGSAELLSSPFFSMRTRLEQTGSTGAGSPPKDQNALEVVQLIGW